MSVDTYFCFCCLSTNELSSLFNSDPDKNHVAQLKELFSVKPSQDYEDDSYICAECAVRLKDAYSFKQQVFETINILQVNGLVELRKLKGGLIITKVYDVEFEEKDEVKNETKSDFETFHDDEEVIQDQKSQQSDLSPVKREPIEIKLAESFRTLRSTKKLQPVSNKLVLPVSNKPVQPVKRKPLTVKGKHNKNAKRRRAYKKKLMESYVVTKDLKCSICTETMPNVYMFHKHMNQHFPNFICETCGKGFLTKDRLRRHLASHNTGPFICQCGAEFTNYSTFNAHRQRKHATQYQYKCPFCTERFRTYPRRAVHLATKHAQRANYSCSECGKTFLMANNLRQHKQSQHQQVKRYPCELCDLGFYRKQDLISHMASHTGANPFHCAECGKSYPRSKALKVHMLTHLDEKPFSCDDCGRKFTQKCALLAHMKTHNALEKNRRSRAKSSY